MVCHLSDPSRQGGPPGQLLGPESPLGRCAQRAALHLDPWSPDLHAGQGRREADGPDSVRAGYPRREPLGCERESREVSAVGTCVLR
jgi:hypothetical protein